MILEAWRPFPGKWEETCSVLPASLQPKSSHLNSTSPGPFFLHPGCGHLSRDLAVSRERILSVGFCSMLALNGSQGGKPFSSCVTVCDRDIAYESLGPERTGKRDCARVSAACPQRGQSLCMKEGMMAVVMGGNQGEIGGERVMMG